MSSMNAQVPNFEEAANVAAEFIYSIDNLPNEVSHILQEIKHRETRTQELQQEIDKDTAKYIRRSRRASPTSITPPSPSSRAPSPKSLPIPARISASYAEIHDLAGEKCMLAEQLIQIINRTRSKLDVDIVKVRTLQGEPPEVIAASIARPLPSVLPTLGAEAFGAPGRNPALAISESLRNALAPAVESRVVSAAASPSPSPSGSMVHVTKKRRVTAAASIKISPAASPKHRSASPTALPATAHTQQKSRLSRQVHPPPEYSKSDADGEGDGDMEEEENEDETLYCFCQKQSYGDMIACDNDDGCPYEWFHLPCVGLKQPPPEKWYCSPACAKNKGLVTTSATTTTTRKGRKK